MDKTRLIVAGRIIDGSGAAVRRGVFLTIKNGIITAIGSTKNLPENSNVAVDDFSHCTILPALVDCSVSLAQSPSVDRSVRLFTEEADFATKRITLERHIHYCQTHGVLGVANSGDLVELQQYSQDRVKPKNIINIRTSGSLCRSRQDCAAANSTAVDFIKVPYSTNVGDDESPHPQLSHEELCHILQHKNEKKTIVVANSPQQVTEALNAGCDAIEQGYGMGEENLRKMAEKHVLWIPNVVRAKNGLDSAQWRRRCVLPFLNTLCSTGKTNPGC